MDWTIEPLVGVGPIRFGDSPEEVAAKIGPARETQRLSAMPQFLQFLGGKDSVTELRSDPSIEYTQWMPNVAYEDGKVVELIMTDSQENLNINGIPFFTGVIDENFVALKTLSQKIAHTDDGTYFFVDLGISMLDEEIFGFEDPVTVFTRGHYDGFIEKSISAGTCRYIKGT
ncbi:MAG: hypothetical protein ACSHXH_11780 [Marivita sp.]|uniref:hypothetical protein n=1 Tax=Marivita sp. TaxID=2003365 RepID=UPI003EF3755D